MACADGSFSFLADKTGMLRLCRDVVVKLLSLNTAGNKLAADLSNARAQLANEKTGPDECESLLRTELDKSMRKSSEAHA